VRPVTSVHATHPTASTARRDRQRLDEPSLQLHRLIVRSAAVGGTVARCRSQFLDSHRTRSTIASSRAIDGWGSGMALVPRTASLFLGSAGRRANGGRLRGVCFESVTV
jgi:hypothetical protein